MSITVASFIEAPMGGTELSALAKSHNKNSEAILSIAQKADKVDIEFRAEVMHQMTIHNYARAKMVRARWPWTQGKSFPGQKARIY